PGIDVRALRLDGGDERRREAAGLQEQVGGGVAARRRRDRPEKLSPRDATGTVLLDALGNPPVLVSGITHDSWSSKVRLTTSAKATVVRRSFSEGGSPTLPIALYRRSAR